MKCQHRDHANHEKEIDSLTSRYQRCRIHHSRDGSQVFRCQILRYRQLHVRIPRCDDAIRVTFHIDRTFLFRIHLGLTLYTQAGTKFTKRQPELYVAL